MDKKNSSIFPWQEDRPGTSSESLEGVVKPVKITKKKRKKKVQSEEKRKPQAKNILLGLTIVKKPSEKHFESIGQQCNIAEVSDGEAMLPVELKLLVENLTLVLEQSKKRSQWSDTYKIRYDLISQLLKVIAEICNRPIQRTLGTYLEVHDRKFEYCVEQANLALDQHFSGTLKYYNDFHADLERTRQSIELEENQIATIKAQIEAEKYVGENLDGDLNKKLMANLKENSRLKAELQFNTKKFQNYKKMFVKKKEEIAKAKIKLESCENQLKKRLNPKK